MNEHTLKEAVSEAERFLKRAKVLQEALKDKPHIFYGTPETSAVRRTSMDLSRALSNLRRYGD